ncbi:MAG: nucleoside triphosphate pyrophosphohydrolase [Pseudomonadota bacterium]|nr:nucleoside triphosphate pyrophosphohydrolase [Pseudomonadota bacterium]
MAQTATGAPSADLAAADPRSVATLIAIMQALRTPVTGCPWDLEQDFASIAPYTIEEAYEVADAIERKDLAALADELGDLLLQVVYHAQLASEDGAFDFHDVVAGICRKMVRRHPHVFGDDTARSAVAAKGFWEEIKSRENAETKRAGGTLGGIPAALPASTRAVKLQAKAARVGFDWPSAGDVLQKIAEEAGELLATPEDRRQEEFGDLLFALANLARHMKIDPEAALRGANAKFERRFAHIESRLAAQGRLPSQSTLAEMDALWDEAKERED